MVVELRFVRLEFLIIRSQEEYFFRIDAIEKYIESVVQDNRYQSNKK